MRILYTTHAYKPAYRGGGGPVLSVAALAEGLVRRGHEVTVYTVNRTHMDGVLDVPVSQPVDVEGVEVRYFRWVNVWRRWLPFFTYMSKSFGYLYSPDMARALNCKVPEVDLVHSQMPFIYPTLATSRSAQEFNKPHFYHQRGVLGSEHLKFRSLKKRLYINLVERRILRNATTLIALTETETESYRALGVDTPTAIVPNGIDVERYRQSPDAGEGCWNFPQDTVVILFLARLHPLKGADKLVRAFLRIKDSFPNAVLVMAGPDEFGLEAGLREVIRDAGASQRVVFPGMVSGRDKINLLARANLFCLPSHAEGFSMAVLEALASGTPVLLSPGCHFPEVEAAGVGRVAPSDPDRLAAALAELLAQPAEMSRMREACVVFVREGYSWEHILDRLLDAYEEGIERHKTQMKQRRARRPGPHMFFWGGVV